jgi:hypothetical protein
MFILCFCYLIIVIVVYDSCLLNLMCYINMGIFTHGYPFILLGNGYGKKLYPLTGMGMGDG